MATGTIGYSDVNVTETAMGYTCIMTAAGAPATITGYLQTVNIRISYGVTIKIKIFRDDGTNYLFIGEQSYAASAGLNSNIVISPKINVKIGDLIAVYYTGVNLIIDGGTAGGIYRKSGDITTDSLKSGWSELPYKAALWGTLQSIPFNGFSGCQPWIF